MGNYCTSKELAEQFEVSTRTIRNYIKRLNVIDPDLIISSSKGYTANPDKSFAEMNNKNVKNQRKIYILRRLIKNVDRGLDLYDLADSLYLSDSTLKSTINFINKDIRQWNLSIKTRDSKLYIDGDPYAIRHLLMNLLNQSSFENFDISYDVQEILGPTIKLDDLYSLSLTYLDSEATNTYFVESLVFHIAVALDRATTKQTTNQVMTSVTAQKIVDEIQTRYALYFLKEDLVEFDELFEHIYHRSTDISALKDNRRIKEIGEVLKELENVYGISFENKDFKDRLIIHISNLYQRAQKNIFSRNLSFEKIKAKYPILFDIAVYLASCLEKKLGIEINDDEIAFLTLHIGSFLKNDPIPSLRLKTAIITPGYLNEGAQIAEQIKREFKDDLLVTDILEGNIFHQLTERYDLIITSFPISEFEQLKISSSKQVAVHDQLLPIEKNAIWEAIRAIKSTYYINEITSHLTAVIRDNHFIVHYTGHTYEEALRAIADKLRKSQSVADNYFDQLIERENASYTSFPSGIAIPHTLAMDAKKTDVVILIPKESIPWGETNVRLIVGLSISKKDRKIFNKIFQRFVEVVSVKENVLMLSKQENPKQFLSRLIHLLGEGNYYE